MDWQLPLTLMLILAAGGYLAWRGWRSWRASNKGCGGGCGCHESQPKQAVQELMLRKR